MKAFVNLLPLSFRLEVLRRRRTRQWGVLWALATVIAITLGWAGYLSHNDAERVKREAEQRINARLMKSEKRVADAKVKLLALRQQEAVLLNPLDNTPGLLVLGIVSRCAGRAEGGIHVEGLSLSRNNSICRAQGLPAEPGRRDERRLTLKGIASDSLAAAAFATGLRDSGVFASVERKLSPTPETNQKRPVPYFIECRF